MAANRKRCTKKKSSITRRDLIKTAVVATLMSSTSSLESKGQDQQSAFEAIAWRRYRIKIMLKVPRVIDNTSSLGSRKYQTQNILGYVKLGFSSAGDLVDVSFSNMTNKSHKLSNGKNVTYDAVIDYSKHVTKFNVIGDNKTKVFRKASVCFSIAAEPSYNIGDIDEETSLYITLAGDGTVDARGRLLQVNGYVAGTLGCGCKAYGHTSPTRTLGYNGATSHVDDVAAVFGRWAMRLTQS